MKTLNITQEQMMDLLQKAYTAVTNGIPGSPNCDELAQEYRILYGDSEKAIARFISTQVAKCTTSGFVTSLGGLVTIPVAIPANIASVIYVQLRMITTIAVMAGYDSHSDEVQTLVYMCLSGMSLADACKAVGVQVANKATLNIVKKIPGTVLTKINQRAGFRLVTKFGTKGVINLCKMVPIIGGAVGGAVDYFGTKAIAKKACDMFVNNEID